MQLGLIPTLFLFFGLVSVFYAAVLHYYLRGRDPLVVDHWSLGCLIWGLAVLATIFRVELPLLVSYFLANAVAFMAYVEINRGLKLLVSKERRKPVRRSFDLLLILGYVAILYALDRWMPLEVKETAKTSFVSLVMVLVGAQGARYCFAIGRVHAIALAHNLGYLFLVVAAIWGARAASAVGWQATHAFAPSALNTVIFVSLFVTGVVKYFVFPMVLLQKVAHDSQVQFRTTLVKANKTVTSGALSASIAHELNQPLAAIRINGQTLRKALEEQGGPGGAVTDDMRAMIDDILSENDRAAKIIASLRAIFTLSPSTRTAQDASQLVQQSLGMVKRELERQQVKLQLDLTDDLLIAVPQDEFVQVLLNLLFNSLQALQEPTRSGEKIISIRARRQAGLLEISVSDNGPGVKPEMTGVLFEILSTSKDSGMGVGLWLCKYIVERHEGSISHAVSPLGGATFIVRLPHCPPDTAALAVLA